MPQRPLAARPSQPAHPKTCSSSWLPSLDGGLQASRFFKFWLVQFFGRTSNGEARLLSSKPLGRIVASHDIKRSGCSVWKGGVLCSRQFIGCLLESGAAQGRSTCPIIELLMGWRVAWCRYLGGLSPGQCVYYRPRSGRNTWSRVRIAYRVVCYRWRS